MKISQLVDIVNEIAPFAIAQSWDNVGLLVGDAQSEVNAMMLAVDITDAVINEAISSGCNTIISYHPVIWEPLKALTAQCSRPVVYRLAREGLNVISVHTALDAACGGVNDGLAEAVGLAVSEPIGDYVSPPTEDMYKLVVFIPAEHINALSEAVFLAGAGSLGNYSNCGFTSQGTGTFLPLDGANPSIGKKGRIEKVAEVRFETLVHQSRLNDVVAAMKLAHPYEEPAFDIIKLSLFQKRLGIGRIGNLVPKRKLTDIIADIKRVTGVETIGFVGREIKSVKSAAVCAGACGSILNKVIAAGCELYVTGEMKHHDALAARESGLLCLCLGHSISERFILSRLMERIRLKCPAEVVLSRKDADPLKWRQV